MFKRIALSLMAALLVGAAGCSGDDGATGPQGPAGPAAPGPAAYDPAPGITPATPIKHLVVIFGENISFDHYFGTYPLNVDPANPTDPSKWHPFRADAVVPAASSINNYLKHPDLLKTNPNALNKGNNAKNTAGVVVDNAINPFLISVVATDGKPHGRAVTASQDHSYNGEQTMYDAGKLDQFPLQGHADSGTSTDPTFNKGLVMGYYDGTAVTALWNYAQQYAMSDNSYGDFGPSSVGVINLLSGQTNGVQAVNVAGNALTGNNIVDGKNGYYTVVEDPSPLDDVCSSVTDINAGVVRMSGQNIGDLLDAKGVSYGGFAGGFDLSHVSADGNTGCQQDTQNSLHTGRGVYDFVPHHAFFNYWKSTANAGHERPACLAKDTPDWLCVGKASDVAGNHNYDVEDFFNAVNGGAFPAVSFLKAIKVEDGHGGNSDPLNEQAFIVRVVNFLQQRPDWKDTAVVILYDDSDGWYDHQAGPLVKQSHSAMDLLNGASVCETFGDQSADFPDKPAAKTPDGINVNGNSGAAGVTADGRCGPGPRQPLMVISPWARKGYVEHTASNQAAVIRFIEDNWLAGARIGHGSNDSIPLDAKPATDKTANSIYNLFDFSGTTPPNAATFLLNCNGTIATTAPANSAAGKNDACAAWFDKAS
ncbi:MAG: alkaline phosphatase family protein [Solimonas sp.]